MSFLPIAVLVPVPAIMLAVEASIGLVTPATRFLFGLSVVVAILMFFRPLLEGLLRAALLAIKPSQTVWARLAQYKLSDVMMLNRMPRDLDAIQPNLAAELRILARRD